METAVMDSRRAQTIRHAITRSHARADIAADLWDLKKGIQSVLEIHPGDKRYCTPQEWCRLQTLQQQLKPLLAEWEDDAGEWLFQYREAEARMSHAAWQAKRKRAIRERQDSAGATVAKAPEPNQLNLIEGSTNG